MNIIEEAIATLGIPGSIAVVLVIVFALLQLIGEFIEAFGKVAPTCLKLRKVFAKRREDKKKLESMIASVQTLLTDVNQHYSADNIAKRDAWMIWVNERAELYDDTIIKYRETIDLLRAALEDNTKMTEQMFIENSRDRIISFASKCNRPLEKITREEFNRIFKVYEQYEQFLADRNLTNGEVEINYQYIKDAYKEHIKNNSFYEDQE